MGAGRGLRTAFVALAAIAVVLTGVALVRQAAHTLSNSTQGRPAPTVAGVTSTIVPIMRLPSTPAALLVVDDDNGKPVTVALIAVPPSGKGGTLVVLPVAMKTDAGTTLGDAYERGGLVALVQAVELGLTISITVQAELRPDALAQLLAPLAPIDVRFDDAVRTGGASGTIVVEPAGLATLTATDAAAVLAARAAEESELVRLGRTAAVWKALLAPRPNVPTQPAGPVVDPVTGPRLTSVPEAIGSLVAAKSTVITINVDPLGATGAGEVLVADNPALRLLIAQILPGAVSPVNGNPRLRILNPSGDAKLSLVAVGRLLYFSANIVLVDETAGAVPARSKLELGDEARRDEMSGYRPALGALDINVVATAIDGVDATVTLGADFAKLVAEQAPLPTTTTSLAPSTPSTSAASSAGASTTTGPPARTTTTAKKG
jgi:hypothetical protein